jgi:hypothetical protein
MNVKQRCDGTSAELYDDQAYSVCLEQERQVPMVILELALSYRTSQGNYSMCTVIRREVKVNSEGRKNKSRLCFVNTC